jgi:hypothetical protein
MFSIIMLHKVILGGIITAVIIITVIGLSVGLVGESKIDITDQSTNQEPYIPKKITLELSDGINMGEAGP